MSYETAVKRASERKRDPFDLYPTPDQLCSAGLVTAQRAIEVGGRKIEYILDAGAASGAWGNAARAAYPNAVIAGTDLRGYAAGTGMFTGARDAVSYARPKVYDYYQAGRDFTRSKPAPVFDMVIGNPPYGVAEEFVRISWDYLLPGGVLVYLLRLAFLEGQARGRGLWQSHQPFEVAVCSDRPSFTGDGKTDATAYAIFIWVKGHECNTSLTWLAWKDEAAAAARENNRAIEQATGFIQTLLAFDFGG